MIDTAETSDLRDPAAERQLLAIALHGQTTELLALPLGAIDQWQHAAIAAAFRNLAARGVPADPTVVLREVVSNAGGNDRAQRLGQLVAELTTRGVPAGSARYYADRLAALHAARELQTATETFRRAVAYAAENDDDQVIASAATAMREAITEAETSFRTTTIDPPMSLAELLSEQEETYDWLVPGLLERMDRLILTGFEGTGKALHVETPIPTPKGWTLMGALNVGDEVFGPDGKPTRVIAATDVMHGRPCYRVRFSDGAEIVADANHMWVTETLAAREAAARQARRGETKARGTDQRHKRRHFPAVVTTREMADTLHARDGHAVNHSIATTAPLQYPAQEQPIDPYVLGCWLGDGTGVNATLTCADEEIIEHIRATGEPIRRANDRYLWRFTDGVRHGRGPGGALTMQARLRAVGVLGDKHIPELYQHASVEQRLALLQGLMDTDGTVDVKGMCEFSVCDAVLAADAYELLLGLGVKVSFQSGPAMLDGREVGTRYRLHFQTDLPAFRLSRKAERLAPLQTRRAKLRYVVAVEPVASVPVRCIQVDRTDAMFVAGQQCIPTHNSYLLAQFALCIAGGLHPFTGLPIEVKGEYREYRTLVFDCENTKRQMRRRYRRISQQVDKLRVNAGFDPADWSDQVRIVSRPEGVSLTEPRELARIEQAIAQTAPDLVIAGPLYKMSKLNIQEEQAAQELTMTLDTLRVRHGFTLICEAHAGHANDGGGNRRVRPIGSSLFLRWPEFGFGIAPHKDAIAEEHPSTVEIKHWRGSRDERAWPWILKHGDALPWEPLAGYLSIAENAAAAS